jgi:hypothetical protein
VNFGAVARNCDGLFKRLELPRFTANRLNFAQAHQSLHVMPVMSAGLPITFWSLEEIIGLLY